MFSTTSKPITSMVCCVLSGRSTTTTTTTTSKNVLITILQDYTKLHSKEKKERRIGPSSTNRVKCEERVGSDYTGCSLNIVFFLISKKSRLWPFSVFPLCVCVCTHQAGRTTALQQNWRSSENSQNFKEKTQFLMNTL